MLADDPRGAGPREPVAPDVDPTFRGENDWRLTPVYEWTCLVLGNLCAAALVLFYVDEPRPERPRLLRFCLPFLLVLLAIAARQLRLMWRYFREPLPRLTRWRYLAVTVLCAFLHQFLDGSLMLGAYPERCDLRPETCRRWERFRLFLSVWRLLYLQVAMTPLFEYRGLLPWRR